VGDKGGEANTLNNIGQVFSDLGKKQKALSYFDQALPLLRQVRDKRVEASTLNNIGIVFSDLGEKQKALSYYDQALPLHRQVGDKDGKLPLCSILLHWNAAKTTYNQHSPISKLRSISLKIYAPKSIVKIHALPILHQCSVITSSKPTC
jgi:tetratricopeptide (TPR) repeat protein